MSDPVFFIEPAAIADCAVGDVVQVSGPEARHAVGVVRLGTDERIDLVDGRGRRVIGRVAAASASDDLQVRVDRIVDEPEPQPRIVVVQALPKGEHGELAVDLMTQAGVDVIVPWAAQHCVAVWRADKAAKGRGKWVAAAERAAKQSRRARVPEVAGLVSIEGVRDLVRGAAQAIVLHESATVSITDIPLTAVGDLVLVVGPEGGLAPREREELAAVGAQEALLGPHVLRSSFAGAAAAIAVASRGRWAAWEDAGHE